MMTGAQFPPLTPLALDFQSTVFVLLVAVILPVGAVRTKSIIAVGRPGRRPPRKSDVLTRALLVQTLLFALSFVVARSHRLALWPWAGVRVADVPDAW